MIFRWSCNSSLSSSRFSVELLCLLDHIAEVSHGAESTQSLLLKWLIMLSTLCKGPSTNIDKYPSRREENLHNSRGSMPEHIELALLPERNSKQISYLSSINFKTTAGDVLHYFYSIDYCDYQ